MAARRLKPSRVLIGAPAAAAAATVDEEERMAAAPGRCDIGIGKCLRSLEREGGGRKGERGRGGREREEGRGGGRKGRSDALHIIRAPRFGFKVSVDCKTIFKKLIWCLFYLFNNFFACTSITIWIFNYFKNISKIFCVNIFKYFSYRSFCRFTINNTICFHTTFLSISNIYCSNFKTRCFC